MKSKTRKAAGKASIDPLVGTVDRQTCEGCETVCNIADMSLTDDGVWLCPGCWGSICEEMRHSANRRVDGR